MWSSRLGFLLVEAALSAVLLTVGLVFISRGLSSQLTAIRAVEEYETLRALLQGTLLELEGGRLLGRSGSAARDGACAEPYQDYHWRLTAAPREDLADQDGIPLASDVTVVVERDDPPRASLALGAVWPREWVP